jgi:MoaA/NifB/PqqE/SkfB family radical SAM enzyme
MDKISMTELGRSLIEEGMEKGMVEGENKKAIEIVKNAIKKGVDNSIIGDLTRLSNEEIEAIRKALKYSN